MIRLLAVLLVLAGCGTAPKESFYTLAAPSLLPQATAMTAHVSVNSLPEAVDRTPMVIGTGPNRVDVEDFHRWAEPLKAAIPRVIAANLSRELGGARVSYGRTSSTGVDYRIVVDVARFDSSFSDGGSIEATWTVTGKSGPPAIGRTLARAPAPSADHAGVASAHSTALAQVAKEIAAAISR